MSLAALIVVMGPSGCGKSTIGAALAHKLGIPMLEGDDFHSSQNKTKMASGHPLADQDRVDWLNRIETRLIEYAGRDVVLACSALTPFVHRRLGAVSTHQTRYLLLETPRDVLAKRLTARSGHYMPASLLASQLASLVRPEGALAFDGCKSVESLVAAMTIALGQRA